MLQQPQIHLWTCSVEWVETILKWTVHDLDKFVQFADSLSAQKINQFNEDVADLKRGSLVWVDKHHKFMTNY